LGEIVLGAADPATGCFPNVNTETLTSLDDGDQLVIELNDASCQVSPYVFHGTGNWHVIGGTGTFVGATGTGTVDGGATFSQDPTHSTRTFNITFTGSISQPNK